jgi:hypothetical protein
MTTTVHRALLLAALTAACLAPARARAAGPAPRPTFVFDTGWDFGVGEKDLLTVDLTDGSSQSLSANDGFWMSAGVAFLRLPAGRAVFDTVTTVGFKYRSIGAGDDGFHYSAFPLEVTERLAWEQVRVGVGLSFALAPSYEGDGVLGDFHAPLNRSLGVLFRADWRGSRADVRGGWYVGARFLWQKLEVKGSGSPFDANALGIAAGFEL